MKHKTVFKKEGVDLLEIKKNGIYFDLTLGAGGHTEEILSRESEIEVFSFDFDSKAIDYFQDLINKGLIKGKVRLINSNFSEIENFISENKIDKPDGIIADLGWSTDQLESIEGLSYQKTDDLLDMRLTQNYGVKASDLLNVLGKNELKEMFSQYGDIRGGDNQKLVKAIIETRKVRIFTQVGDLNEVIEKVFRINERERWRIYGKIYQSLRIAVNNEKKNLEEMIDASWRMLKGGGRFVVITFHSGEEKIVRDRFFKFIENKEGIITSSQYGEVYTRPSVEELTNNLSSRSAKLWAIKKYE